MTHDDSETIEDPKILRELDESIKTQLDTSFISMIINNGESNFLSIWKRPCWGPNRKERVSSMKYLPLFYVICSIDETSNIVFKLITHHGKVIDTLSNDSLIKEDNEGELAVNEACYEFIRRLETLKMCRGVENLNFPAVPHFAEQMEEELIVRSRECKFALFQDEVTCQACQNLAKHKYVKIHCNTNAKARHKCQSRMCMDTFDLYQNLVSDGDQKMNISSTAVNDKLEEDYQNDINRVSYIVDSDQADLPQDISFHDIQLETNQLEYESRLKANYLRIPADIEDKDGLKENAIASKSRSSSLLQRKKINYSCDKCLQTYSTKHQLKKHAIKVHNKSDIHPEKTNQPIRPEENNKDALPSSHECENSEKSKQGDAHQHREEDIPGNVKSFVCGKCDKHFSSKTELSRHRKEEHSVLTGETLSKRYKCPNCDFTTSRKTGLTDHINAVHEKVKPYMCQHCSHTFASNGNLTQHIHAVHEKLRPFICQYCSYATSSQPNLRKHIKAVHHKIRDFKCELCPFDAASKQLLVRHVKAVHEKIKAYKCKYCQYECAKGYNMKVHVRHVHEKLKGYKCDQCSFEATRKGKLTEHQITCHDGEVVVSVQESNSNQIISNIISTPSSTTETIIVHSPIETRSVLVDSSI